MAKDSTSSRALKLTRAVEAARTQGAAYSLDRAPMKRVSDGISGSVSRSSKNEIKFANKSAALRQLVATVQKPGNPVATKSLRLRPRPGTEAGAADKLEETSRLAREGRPLEPVIAREPSGARVRRSPSLAPTDEPAEIRSVLALGDMVRHARRREGLSQADVARMAGTGRRFISDLEAGKPTLEFERLLNVCHALGITILASEKGR